MGSVWILNLDAEQELERPRGYTPSARSLAMVAAHEATAAAALLAADDVLWREGTPPPSAWGGRRGRAYCPTPRAVARLRDAGCTLEPFPSLAALQAANDRGTCFALGPCLADSAWIPRGADAAEALHALRARSGSSADRVSGGRWLAKRAFGCAGRGQRRLAAEAPTAADVAWLRAALRRGGVLLEPFVTAIEAEYSWHAWLTPRGEIGATEIVGQLVDAHGVWRRVAERCAAPRSEEGAEMRREGERTAAALHACGYFGPFGIDAYRGRFADGSPVFVARGEINARFTLGWGLGTDPR